MEPSREGQVTSLLQRWRHGDEGAARDLFPLVYHELRRIAQGVFRGEYPGHTLQPTAVVHEAYLRLCQGGQAEWRNRTHFYAVMARVMRRVLTDHARRRLRVKRGGGMDRGDLEQAALQAGEVWSPDLIDLDDALRSLARHDPQKAAVVELRFFGGLTEGETAQTLGISRTTVVREQRRARAWLAHRLGSSP